MRKIVYLLTGLLATVGLALAGALPASASVIPPIHFSTFLAGTHLQGNGTPPNGTIFNGTWRQVTVPDESPAFPPVPANSVAVGIALTQFTTGGLADAEALVWDNPAGCGAGMWTLEITPAAVPVASFPSPMPVTTAQLVPLHVVDPFAANVCIAGAGSEFLYLYHSNATGQVDFSAGPGGHSWDILHTDFGQFQLFRSGDSGITTTTGLAASLLVNGTVLGSSGVGYFVQGRGNTTFGQGVNLTSLNYAVFEGTEFGGAPSVINPLSLTVNPLNPSSNLPFGAYQIDAP